MATGKQEQYFKGTTAPASPRRLDRVLESSALVTSTGALDQRAAAHPDPATPGADPLNPGGGVTNTYTQAAAGAAGAAVGATHFIGDEAGKTGMYQLLKTDIFNMLVFPPLRVTAPVTT